MKIEEIDKNLKIETKFPENDIVWYDSNDAIFAKYGLINSDNGFLRMPKDVANKVSDGVTALCADTSGVRIRLCTDSPYIALKAVFPYLTRFSHMPITGTGGFDLYREIGSQQFFVGTFVPPINADNGFESFMHTGNTSGKTIDYIINFPLYNPVTKLYIGLKENCKIETSNKYINDKPVVFYGSSITQGGCASRPGNSYQNFLSRALNMDYFSLGFSGSARGEKEIAEYMAELQMCAFVSDYDHNAPDPEHLKRTHFALYQTVRDKNPELPYIMITHPSERINEPVNRRKIIMESYLKALNNGDKNVYYIDGDSLFAGYEFDSCTVDGCHPNDLGFYRMAQGILPIMKEILYLH